MARNDSASQNINEPAHHFFTRLVTFHRVTKSHMPGNQASSLTVAPPAMYLPELMASATSLNNSHEG